MKSIPLALSQEVGKEFNSLGHLIELGLSTPIYYTDKDLDVYYNSKTYLSRGIVFDQAQYSLLPKVDNLTFELDNVQLEASAIVMSQEIRGRVCTIYRAAFDASLNVIGITPLFIGYLDKVEVNQQRARFEIYSHFIKWNTQTPRRTHVATCGWVFKDPVTCKYAGAGTTCDKTWTTCQMYGNTPQFGGFRWLTPLVGRQIYWGRKVG